MRSKINWALFICVFFAVSGVASAQKLWEKPYEKWSRDDAISIVSSSPWATTYQSRESVAASSARQGSIDQRDSANSGGNGALAGSMTRVASRPPVVARLHSGLPIRQAITRGRQIAAGYDKMDADKKKAFDESNKGFLQCAICQNYYVVSLTTVPDSTNQSIEEAIFLGLTIEDLKGNVALVNEKGEERELVQITPPKRPSDSAYLFFARKDDKGELLVTPDTKIFKLVFKNNFFTSSNRYASMVPRSFEFNATKLVVGGELLF